MKKAVIFLADGFEEMEALVPVDLMRRAGISVTVAGVTGKECKGAHNVRIAADCLIGEINEKDYDAFVCPGGGVGAQNLRNSEEVRSIIRNAFKSGKLTAAICASPIVLEAADILNGKNYTIYPSMKDVNKTGSYKDEEVVVDGTIITGAGPAAAGAFGFSIIEYLLGKEARDKVAEETLHRKFNR